MRFLLDTNVIIAAMKGEARVRNKLETTALSEIVLSPVVLGELEHGVEKSQHREKNRARLTRIVEGMHLIPLDAEDSRRYGAIRAELERKGTPIGANDYWIAAQALANDAVLVTDNISEFSRISGLTVENWLRP
jgi:tRNA(fMet)-specific endonuclease VapC